MKLLLALGNQGDRYRDTRHNAGWWLADHLVSRWQLEPFHASNGIASTQGRLGDEAVLVAKPLTFMNLSGRVLPQLLDGRSVDPESDLLVLVDDVSLPPGSFRLRAHGSAGGHNGLGSVEAVLESRSFSRLRIGVGAPPSTQIDLAEWVLAAPQDNEEQLVLESFDRMAEAVEWWVADGAASAMNEFN
ncbi:MAG: aminoacyl-tRNA hydrolase [Gemmatimonadales bacterium]|nr:MAG: aminoacyl-tRNA hydrolase [Gemmatimonadales bacterium]